MCGRYVHPDQAAIERTWHIGRHNNNPLGAAFKRRFNVTPSAIVPVLRIDAQAVAFELTRAHWGFVPHWWKESKPPRNTINARTEEITQKPMWRTAYRHSRCLIPAEGWYEWRVLDNVDEVTGEVKQSKQPYYIHPVDDGLICFAGLYSASGPEGSCAILTGASRGAVTQVHDRMPVVLAEEAYRVWLDPNLADASKITELMTGAARDDFVCTAVSTLVNSGRTEGAQLITPLVALNPPLATNEESIPTLPAPPAPPD